MGDGHPDIDDLPVTVGTLKTQGDIYAAGADSPNVRMIDTFGRQVIVQATGDTNVTEVDPRSGSNYTIQYDQPISQPLVDYINLGLSNANWQMTPPEPDLPISADNPLPFWTAGGTSATGAYIKWGGAERLEFVVPAAGLSAGDDIWIEQNVPYITQTGGGQWAMPRVIIDRGSYAPSGDPVVYLSLNGTQVTSASINTFLTSFGDGFELVPTAAEMETWLGLFSTDTAVYSIRVGLKTAVTSATSGTAYATRIELMQSKPRIVLGAGWSSDTAIDSYNAPEIAELQYIRGYQDLGFRVGSLRRIISRSLVPIPFVLLNVPAGATTQMQIPDVALGLGTPRIGMGFNGSIVGLSYRMSAAITAGGATALQIQATVGGASVWTAHTLTTASSQSGENTQTPDLDEFIASAQLGVQVVTSGTFAPTTLDIVCLLWVALRYNL